MIMIITVINFTMGLFLITSILTIVEKYGENAAVDELLDVYVI